LTLDAYDQLWAETWGDQQRFGPVHRHQRNELLKVITSLGIDSVLDVGCGSGENLAALARANPHLVLSGIDVSREALALAVQRLPGVQFSQLDVQTERLNEHFDLVMCNQVIEHLIDDIAALRNITLMSNRWVLVATMRGRMRPSERKIGHFRNYSDIELRAKAEAAGLEVVDIFGWGFPFYSPLFRTAVEWLPEKTAVGKFGATQRMIANFLYHLYSLNIPRRGDVVTMLACPRGKRQEQAEP
jgi:SAM-dependent methyltransferase